MPTCDLFSRRKAREESGQAPDVYSYDYLPESFRTQVVHVLRDTIGIYAGDNILGSSAVWKMVHKILLKEYGVFHLGSPSDPDREVLDFLLNADDVLALDVIEICMRAIDSLVRKWSSDDRRRFHANQDAQDAISEINTRFEQHGLGYEYLNGSIIRKDSQFIHAEIVKPALALLQEAQFQGAQDEFLQAHMFYRQGKGKQAVAEALKAFESTMKTICTMKDWPIDAGATAKPLIHCLITNGLIPPPLESQFTGLRVALESGLPTVSNRTGRHGQGLHPTDVADSLVRFCLHLCASNIVLLVRLYQLHE